MSSLVQAKWMNSSLSFSSGTWPMRWRSQYSTAFTSWLVSFSMSLIAWASASEKRTTSERSRPLTDSGSAGNSEKPASDSAMNHSTSTCTRRCIRPNSDSSGRSAASLGA